MRSQLWWRAWCALREQEQMLSSPTTQSRPLNGWKKTVLSNHLILRIVFKFIKLFLIWEMKCRFLSSCVVFNYYTGWVDVDVPLFTVTCRHERTKQGSTVQSDVVCYSQYRATQYSTAQYSTIQYRRVCNYSSWTYTVKMGVSTGMEVEGH